LTRAKFIRKSQKSEEVDDVRWERGSHHEEAHFSTGRKGRYSFGWTA